jgi:hypothetical protein
VKSLLDLCWLDRVSAPLLKADAAPDDDDFATVIADGDDIVVVDLGDDQR